ncbi:hypothetical protein DEU56DRAFT_733676 [Suillus clintonianus]|uniref:uncharacterized protein n=1 Tax=Suillus clintonianus TaxID=1904413 RepID=UPI001B879D0B|nr:uncharacterized protein DEU56DRAFT_733676 [Suillus clintonianus]KAG2142398.1 hypothetical protein DEU56DRAFT_733676 [Suillus clintonianus]
MTIALDYGAMLVGGLLAFNLSGCVSMQFIVYCRTYFRESWLYKRMSMGFRLLDLSHSALVAVALWDSIIATYGDLDKLDIIPWYVYSDPTASASLRTEFSYVSYFSLFIGFHALMSAGSAKEARCSNSDCRLSLQSYHTFFQRFSWIFTLGLLISALVDIMITTFMCYILRKNDQHLQSNTIRIIDALTFWTIQNGSMTSAATISTLLCWKIMPQNRIFLGLHFVVAKLYANSLLATLNARKQIWNGKQYTTATDQPMPIVFLENFEHAPESPITQQGFSASNMAATRR